MTYIETMYTLSRIYEIGNALLRESMASMDAQVREPLRQDAVGRALGAMTWLDLAHRLDGPWADLSLAVVTGRHRVRSS